MNMRTIVFLGLVVCSNASTVGMSRLGNCARLAATNLARRNLARLKTDIVSSKESVSVGSKEIACGERGSIAVSKEDVGFKRIFTNYLPNNQGKLAMTAAFYVRSRNQQYASLMCSYDYSKLIAHIEESLHEGVDECTKKGDVLEQITAIYTDPDISDRRFQRSLVCFLNEIEPAKRYKPLLELIDSLVDSKQLLKMMEVLTHAASKKHTISGHVSAESYLDWNTDGFELFLDPCQKQSYYQHMLPFVFEEKGGFVYQPQLLYEHQQIAVARDDSQRQ